MAKNKDLDFKKGNGLIPAVIQDVVTGRVVMLGFMDKKAYKKTVSEGKVTFYSRTKDRIWTKGETSGNYLEVDSIVVDCDRDTLLIKVRLSGPVCHTGTDTCFREGNHPNALFMEELERVIHSRKHDAPTSSYTARLFDRGVNKIAQKLGEEAVELIIEAKDNDKSLFLGEASDMLYHFLVLLAAKDVQLYEVMEVLKARRKK